MRFSDWSSDVCPSDLPGGRDEMVDRACAAEKGFEARLVCRIDDRPASARPEPQRRGLDLVGVRRSDPNGRARSDGRLGNGEADPRASAENDDVAAFEHLRSEEHTSDLQSLMRNWYAVFCLNK